MPISIDVAEIADPDGEDADAQQAIIEAQGFTVERIEVYSDTVAEGVVISHTIEASEFGSTVTLTVSLGEIGLVGFGSGLLMVTKRKRTRSRKRRKHRKVRLRTGG